VEFDFSKQNKIRVRHAGDFSGLPADIQKEISDSVADTAGFEGMQVILAINYGGRDEIVRAFRKLASTRFADNAASSDSASSDSASSDSASSDSALNVSEDDIRACLDNPDVPDPELIIRSAGEYRTSNFLLWEGAYSELYISQKFWPDWDKEDLEEAIGDFQNRDRRFGGVNS
jgi:undecaprenyl diphosphate synthase